MNAVNAVTAPRAWTEVTPAWLGSALGRPVTDLILTDLVDGTNAHARAIVRYADGSNGSVFIKREGSLLGRLALTALGAREAEVELVRQRVELPLERPRYLAAATDRRWLATIVVMEDVTARGASPNSAARPLAVDEVAAGLRELARLHERYWDAPLPPFIRPWRLSPAWAPLARAGFARALSTLRRFDRPLAVCPAELERGFRAWAITAASGPQTLLHGDPHSGNTYAMGSTTGFYDWQLIRSGTWAHDVGYFLISSLTVADRREHEQALLAEYLKALRRPAPDAWALYRSTPIFGLGSWLQTLAAGRFQPVDICLATIERFAAAYFDSSISPGRYPTTD